jgi:hypothetical protein
MRFKTLLKTAIIAGIAATFAGTAAGDALIYGGLEDHPGMSGIEGHGDYNDLIFSMRGNLNFLAPGGSFYNLTKDLVDESGTVYWGQPSSDGEDMNFGYCLTGGGNCAVSHRTTLPLQYLATQDGGDPASILFQAQGIVTIELLTTITAGVNTLGWFDPNSPAILHPIFGGTDPLGTVVTFAPSGTFGLYSGNVLGQVYSSVAGWNINEATDHQHFAFAQAISTVPEPGSASFALLALGILWIRSRAQ